MMEPCLVLVLAGAVAFLAGDFLIGVFLDFPGCSDLLGFLFSFGDFERSSSSEAVYSSISRTVSGINLISGFSVRIIHGRTY